MDKILKLLAVLPALDWAAMVVFFATWTGYVVVSRRHARNNLSVLGATNAVRRRWMLQTTYREVRVIDGIVIQNLSTSPSFFASTTILIIGGLLAMLGTDRASEFVSDLPFATRTSLLIFELKLILLLGIFIHAFFRFTWSMRQYTFGALLIAAAPEHTRFETEGLSREAFAEKAGHVVSLAAETFNNGLRAYYFSFAAIGWFLSPVVFMALAVGVVYVLYQREFRSEVLSALQM